MDKITKKGAKPELEDKKEDLGGGGGGIVTMSLVLLSSAQNMQCVVLT